MRFWQVLSYLMLLLASCFAQANMIQVSSNLWDISKQQEKRIAGVGSLIIAGERFFVLTVGHVSLGTDLQIQGADGSTFTPMNRWDDGKYDVSLLEVVPTRDQVLKYTLAAYYEHPDVKGKVLRTNLAPALEQDQDQVSLMSNDITQQRYRSTIVDMVNLFHLDEKESSDLRYDPARVIVAPWLPCYSWISLEKMLFRHNDGWYKISPDSKKASYEIQVPFMKGYSGSPLLIHHGRSRYSIKSLYSIGGIFTLANMDAKVSTSRVVGPAVLHRLIERALARDRNAEELPLWFLADDIFLSLGKDLVVYATEGPIGNGIAPVGKAVEDRNDTNSSARVRIDSKAKFEEKIQRLQNLNQKMERDQIPPHFIEELKKNKMTVPENRLLELMKATNGSVLLK